ncbi:MAG: hypothetical protein HY717_02750 [Planctomycetes bacterium]|nr:hypothetical protein [Planctomycetota bacterium]
MKIFTALILCPILFCGLPFAAASEGSFHGAANFLDDDKPKDKPDDKEKPDDKKEKEDPEKEKDGGKKAEDEGTKPKLSIDEEYVRDHLKDFLNPTEMEFLKDGRVKLRFNFREKNPIQEDIFTPPISDKFQSNFRWSIPSEWWGLRLGNKGSALLNCWFKDDVEAQIEYLQGINFSNRHTMALIFCNDKNAALGANFGSQCARFDNGAVKESRGKPDPTLQDTPCFIKLVLREGTFEAHRDKRKKETMSYSPKTFGAGRIGLLWGGNVAGVIRNLEIVGRIDASRMVKEIQKGKKK